MQPPRTARRAHPPLNIPDGVWQANTRQYGDDGYLLDIIAYSGDAGDDGRMVSVEQTILEAGSLDPNMELSDAETKAVGALLAAAPDLYRALARLKDAIGAMTLPLTDAQLNGLVALMRDADIALAQARGDETEARLLMEADLEEPVHIDRTPTAIDAVGKGPHGGAARKGLRVMREQGVSQDDAVRQLGGEP